MIISDTLLLLCLISVSHGLSGLNSLFGDKGSKDSNNNMILCTVRHSVHYSRVYDTVLVNKVKNGSKNPPSRKIYTSFKCHPTTTSSCGKGGSCGTQKKCTSKIETVCTDLQKGKNIDNIILRFMKMNAQQKRTNHAQLFMTPLMRTNALQNMSGDWGL